MNADKNKLSGVDEVLVILEDSEKDFVILEDEPQISEAEKTESSWKVLLVDDNRQVHQATKLILRDFKYANIPLKFISAYSGQEAKKLIKLHPDTAVILLDVVMETNDAGLKLAQYIREEEKNYLPRIILRTGQPGEAPEETVILDYDIDDYKTKTELTRQRLFVTMVAGLKSYKKALQLAESQKKVRNLTGNLEQLVAERTRELEATNARLEREIEQGQKTEIASKESEAKFKGIVDISMSAIISIDENQLIQLFNQGAETIFGYQAEEVLGKSLDMLLPSAFRQSHKKYVENFEDDSRETRKMGERSREVFGLRKNGEKFPASASISKLKLHSGTIFTVMLQDVSDRVLVEEELRQTIEQLELEIEQRQKTETASKESEAKFKGIVDISMSAIISIDEKQLIQLFNQGAETIFGYKAEEVLGKSLDVLLPSAFRQSHKKYVQNFEEDSRETRKMGERSKEVFGLRKNGEKFPASASISKLKLHSGTIFTVMLQDVSDRVLVEEELRQTIEQQKAIAKQLENAKEAAEAANRTKSEFLANMSHEIRTPMNAILGFSDLLKDAVAEPKAKAYIKSIASSGKALLSIVNDILDLSKIEAGKLELHYEPVDLRFIVEEIKDVLSLAASQKAVSLVSDIAETVPVGISFDEVRLRQILFNLVGNAIKFSKKGYVKIIVAASPSIPPIIEAESNSHCWLPNVVWLEVAVEDTGIGIETAQKDLIFGSFVQSEGQSNRKYGGSGLGLAITKRLTEMLGGAIALESEPDKGSTFTCYFPALTLPNYSVGEAIAPYLDEDLEGLPALMVLAVDDIQSNLDLIEGYFAGSKHQLLLAKDGIEALALARQALPDIILMDLRMPNMDGQDAIKFLKQDAATKDIPIAILSASLQESDLQDIKHLYSGFLPKPISRSQVVAQLKKIFPSSAKASSPPTTTAPAPEETSSPNLTKLPELLAKLRSYEEDTWCQLLETMKMRELREFAECLKGWGMEYECPPLVDYATVVETLVEEFDWDNLPNSVKAFPEVRRSLELLVVN